MKYRLLAPLVLLAAGCVSPDPPSTPAAGSTLSARETPISIEGQGISNSAPFRLTGGQYAAAWEATAGTAGCHHTLTLAGARSNYLAPLVSLMVEANATRQGTGYAYRVPPGDYYVQAASGCRWRVTFSRQ